MEFDLSARVPFSDFAFTRKPRSLWLLAALMLAPALHTQTPLGQTPPAQTPKTSAKSPLTGAPLEKIWTGGTQTEGPAVAFDGSLFFCDRTPTDMGGPLAAGHIYRFDPRTGKASVYRSPAGQPNGLKFDRDGRLLVAEGADGGGRRLSRTDAATGKSEIVAATYRERALNSPNDLTLDGRGRIYFTDPRYDGREPLEQPVQGVYRADTDGSVHLIIADIVPNGIAISPDERTLYVTYFDLNALDTRNLPPDVPRRRIMRLLAYELRPDGTVDAGSPRVLVDYGAELGADGIAVDAQGDIYAAVGALGRRGVRVYAPDGRELGQIPTPETPRNLAFGRGADAKTLYITAGGSVYRTSVAVPGLTLPR